MVKWSIPARDDLREIHDYIARDSPQYARKVVEEILEKSHLAAEHPLAGRVVPETDDTLVREWFIYSYRLVYEVLNDDITVLAVIHMKRNLDPEELHMRRE